VLLTKIMEYSKTLFFPAQEERGFCFCRAAINSAFNAALVFYRQKRGKRATAIDVSSFFRRRGLHSDFLGFWRSQRNKHRNFFKKSWQKFEKALKEAQ